MEKGEQYHHAPILGCCGTTKKYCLNVQFTNIPLWKSVWQLNTEKWCKTEVFGDLLKSDSLFFHFLS